MTIKKIHLIQNTAARHLARSKIEISTLAASVMELTARFYYSTSLNDTGPVYL